MIITNLIAAVIQVFLFTLIPFLIFMIEKKTAKGFFNKIGLYRTNGFILLYSVAIGLVIGIIGIFMMRLFPSLNDMAVGKGTVPASIRQVNNVGEKIVLTIFIALIKTALSEEILFRGGLAKWLIRKLGFLYGNLLQAVTFGVLHIAMFWASASGVGFLLFSFALPATGGYLAAYFNERRANGSILPGWMIHGSGNLLSYGYLVFFN